MDNSTFYLFIKNKAKEKSVKLDDLAKACNIGRTTLYRFMKQETPITSSFETNIIKFLKLDANEKNEMSLLLKGENNEKNYSGAYEYIDEIMFGEKTNIPLEYFNFEFYEEDKKLLKTSNETIRNIVNLIDEKTTNVDIHSSNFKKEKAFSFLYNISNQINNKYPQTGFKHFIALDFENSKNIGHLFKNIINVLSIENYNVYYKNENIGKIENNIADNIMLIAIEHDKGKNNDYFLILINENKASKCMYFKNSTYYEFFISFFVTNKYIYGETLIQANNSYDIDRAVEYLETSAENALIKNELCIKFIPKSVWKQLYNRTDEARAVQIIQYFSKNPVQYYEIEHFFKYWFDVIDARNASKSQIPSHFVTSKNALIKFMDTGVASLKMPLIVFNKSERKEIIKHLYNRVSDDNDSLNLLITDMDVFPLGVSLLVNKDNGILVEYDYFEDKYATKNVLINNKAFNEMFISYVKEHLPYNYVYTKEKTLYFLNSLLDRI